MRSRGLWCCSFESKHWCFLAHGQTLLVQRQGCTCGPAGSVYVSSMARMPYLGALESRLNGFRGLLPVSINSRVKGVYCANDLSHSFPWLWEVFLTFLIYLLPRTTDSPKVFAL